MRIFFSVGEPSGDLHGSNLIRRMKRQHPDIECVGYGGPKMQEAGCTLHYDLTSLAVMFIAEALKNLRFFFSLVGKADEYFSEHEVDAVVLIDYPGFNWWIARKAKKHRIPVFYYGTPQVWAWAPWRVRKIRKLVDHVLCKLPFEVDWFAKRKCHATYVGHPYFDQIATQKYDNEFVEQLEDGNEALLTLLPGSRNQEVVGVLPILLSAAGQISQQVEAAGKKVRVVVASYNEHQQGLADAMIAERGSSVETFVGKTPELMKAATACVACSGSVSMELLHHRKPTVIVYKVKRWVMIAQGILLRTKFITLVNLIASKDIKKRTWRPFDPDAIRDDPTTSDEQPIMPEYLTTGDPSKEVTRWVVEWLTNEDLIASKRQTMDELAQKYARSGATERAADYILNHLGLRNEKSADRLNSKTNSRSAA